MHSILKELISDPETDPAKLGKKAVDRLYEEFPDLTPLELEALTETLPLPTRH